MCPASMRRHGFAVKVGATVATKVSDSRCPQTGTRAAVVSPPTNLLLFQPPPSPFFFLAK